MPKSGRRESSNSRQFTKNHDCIYIFIIFKKKYFHSIALLYKLLNKKTTFKLCHFSINTVLSQRRYNSISFNDK
jgi:hypothetical protein